MQKLTEALKEAPEKLASDTQLENLVDAAAEWAAFVVKNLDDPLIEKALAISVAVARFTAELARVEAS